MEPVNLDVMLARFAEHWSPKRIAQVNNAGGELTAEVEQLG